MKTVESVRVNSKKKVDKILDMLRKQGRFATYDQFLTFDGTEYLIWYRAR